MKKTFILLFVLASSLMAGKSYGQGIVRGLEPAGAVGLYDYRASVGWGADIATITPVEAFAALVDDGTAADTLGCNPLINGAAISGKIAFVYRGACNFSVKVQHAVNAGAVAVVIINNVADAPIAPGGGTTPPTINVPIVMISQATGQFLRPFLVAGTLKMLIGSKVNYFSNDLYLKNTDIIRPVSFATPSLIAQDTSEFKVKLGGLVKSYGSATQTGVSLRAVIKLGNTTLYDEVNDTPTPLTNADSVEILLPDFFLPNATPNKYTLTYTVSSDATEEDSTDNSVSQDFYITDGVYSKSRYDFAANKPITAGGAITSNTAPANIVTWGITMEAPKASRIRVNGLQFAVITNATDSFDLTGETVTVSVYEWTNDNQDGLIQAGEMVLLGQVFYEYPSNLQGEFVTANFDNAIFLADDKSYYFAIAYQGTTTQVFYNIDEVMQYSYSIVPYNQYFNPVGLNVDGGGESWSSGFTSGSAPSIAVLTSANDASIEETMSSLQLSAYPNPANEMVNITFGNAVSDSKVNIEVIDITGRTIMNKQFNIDNAANYVTINTADLSTGSYFFKVNINGQVVKSLPVVIAK